MKFDATWIESRIASSPVAVLSKRLSRLMMQDIAKHGPSRRYEIAQRIGVHPSTCYEPLRRNRHLFKQCPHTRNWSLATGIVAVQPDTPQRDKCDKEELRLLGQFYAWVLDQSIDRAKPVHMLRFLKSTGQFQPQNVRANEG